MALSLGSNLEEPQNVSCWGVYIAAFQMTCAKTAVAPVQGGKRLANTQPLPHSLVLSNPTRPSPRVPEFLSTGISLRVSDL